MWNRIVTAIAVFAASAHGQPDATARQAAEFEVISFKYAGTPMDHTTVQNGRHTTNWRPVEYKGLRLSADAPLRLIVEFACLPLFTPYHQEAPDWTRFEYYRIDAIAPSGTSLDGARTMLRKALTERLGFQYHLADRETPVYYLVRGGGPLKLTHATEPDPKAGSLQSTWRFRQNSATLARFAKFLASVVGRDVVDRTGIEEHFRFDVDWSAELQRDPGNDGAGLAMSAVKVLGLKLEAGKELRKILIVDRVNQRPTPN
jgi:uncharacterized protein (TIGR03435 family)